MGIFSNIFKNKKPLDKTYLVTAQLNHLLMPIDRGNIYEDPLNEALKENNLGEVDGGGTMQNKTGEIEFIDVEIILYNLEEGIPFLIKKLEELGAPKSSLLHFQDESNQNQIEFGKKEGLAIYLDGINLPKEVYENSDINDLIEKLNNSITDIGRMESYWQGQAETALYFYGENAEKIKENFKPILENYPLCKGCRISIIAPK
ncbi:hypothetical protein [Leptospira brenneri]|uniref:hypothetical protein n=1 Tax=Leptospira brenneri TaxID=2023182 RepID=UPI000C2A3906|nr:hypothetical protein [Leptospira brenneri]PJZ43659.1 hypothetical protein CH361_19345 [Leptospira brenneri]